MISAIVLIKAEVARIPEAAQEIAAIEGISEVYSVTGDIDLVAVAKVAKHEDFHTVIADQLNKVAGVLETNTHIAFRTYSSDDLEAGFSIGLDD
ncbi:Lrp/AsnC family transcriptional regulator [Ornithinimicrobium sp. INDO-MA30-4]|uniref:Lrp/AsnC family transcriptional regulator n=1 Tax=Ornithinimicrobium sp. INDO-MA30-4 TaxID=2908651 RepID=UPI001F19AF68|nr:Lrp/AsnC ligand binding domain-containing protein [Ornithinimicrobium sp. INDO-MA30-4]UJH71310.1 Lrp/AsnC ligand binding domain-containing protein [Ornithinimicrobium sp. INDO-MA30-4]